MAIAMSLMAQSRNGPEIQKQFLYYPVTNACFDTPSYRQLAVNYYLYYAGMEWFWRQYITCAAGRAQITVSPLRAGLDRLRGLPGTMMINGQADVLRNEGEASGERLRCAAVSITALRVHRTLFTIL